jgi:hypothetical protein
MTDERRQDLIKALLEEKRGYVLYGTPEQVAGVDAELARLGAEGKTKAQRSVKRVTAAKESRG